MLKLHILSQACMDRGKCWLLLNVYMRFIIFKISVKLPTSTFKNCYLAVLYKSLMIRSYKADVVIFWKISALCRFKSAILIKCILPDAESHEEHNRI